MTTARTSRRRHRHTAPMSEINVTPFVDVMLVLLIIFMVAAPLMTLGVPLDLPRTAAKSLPQEREPLTISINRHGRVFFQDNEVAIADLADRLSAIAGEAPQTRILVRGDTNAGYGMVMKVMGRISAAGFSRVGLVTEPES